MLYKILCSLYPDVYQRMEMLNYWSEIRDVVSISPKDLKMRIVMWILRPIIFPIHYWRDRTSTEIMLDQMEYNPGKMSNMREALATDTDVLVEALKIG